MKVFRCEKCGHARHSHLDYGCMYCYKCEKGIPDTVENRHGIGDMCECNWVFGIVPDVCENEKPMEVVDNDE